MEAILLIDFGSTNTKVTAVDVGGARLLGTAAAYTTVETDVGEGLSAALEELKRQTGPLRYARRLACSSAAGGLRMIACGLVPELTAKAARLASLGAGAKVIAAYSYQLTEEDVAEIASKRPDILLLTGGIDGGNTECILHNAEMLAGCPGDFPIVAAGNRSCASAVMRRLEGRAAYLTENVMPELNRLNVLPAQSKVRELFLERIVRAKGLTREAGLADGILMPTPAAVMTAVELLSRGADGVSGAGELVAVDLGGATTDVYSIAEGMPRSANTVYKGLPEPYAKRTVEGDIGMRYSAQGVAEAAGIERVAKLAGISADRAREMVDRLSACPGALPQTDEDERLDFALARLAVEAASIRHAGALEQVYTAMGVAFVQSGKDLTDAGRLVLTGGAAIHARRLREIAAGALYSPSQPQSLRPKRAELLADKKYILAAMGLLAGYDSGCALSVMKKELVSYGTVQQEA